MAVCCLTKSKLHVNKNDKIFVSKDPLAVTISSILLMQKKLPIMEVMSGEQLLPKRFYRLRTMSSLKMEKH
jgi:hypothetical protein